MTESPVKTAWDKYQAAAARNPFSDETKRARTAYRRALTVANNKRKEGK
jgi:hypothetical protein